MSLVVTWVACWGLTIDPGDLFSTSLVAAWVDCPGEVVMELAAVLVPLLVAVVPRLLEV